MSHRFETQSAAPRETEPLSSLNSLEKWRDGLDLEKGEPKPFALNLQDFHTKQEMAELTAGKTAEEAAEMIQQNNEIVMQNNMAINDFNEHILDIANLTPQEVEELYQDGQTSNSDKSIIACIEAIRSTYAYWPPAESNLRQNIARIASAFDGLRIVDAQERLKHHNAYFKILTKREREAKGEGSLEDIASAALESFAINPNYQIWHIAKYEQYLRGIAIDCLKRRVVSEAGADKIESEIDLQEFQERVMESQSWAVLDQTSRSQEYTDAEYDDLQIRNAERQADALTGHHFDTAAERNMEDVKIAGRNERKNIYEYADEQTEYAVWDVFKKRVRQNNREAFAYSRELAIVEMKPWADKVNLDRVEEINQDQRLNYEEKCVKIAACIQEAFDIHNLDEDGQSQPITVAFRDVQLPKIIESVFKTLKISQPDDSEPDDALPEVEWYLAGYYLDYERAIVMPRPKNPKKKLTISDIDTLAHEMWHAKQHDMTRDDTAGENIALTDEEMKRRLYSKNNLAYRLDGIVGYSMQVMEREASVIGNTIGLRVLRRNMKRIGKTLLNALT